MDPNATRCLFVGNIPKGVSVYELRDTFLPFGLILVRVGYEYHYLILMSARHSCLLFKEQMFIKVAA